jgi:hypothetical protein
MEEDHVMKKTRSRVITWTLAFVIGCYSTFVLQQFWNWFATPILLLQSISFWEAYGLILLISFLFPKTAHDEHRRNFSHVFSLLEKFCIPETKQDELREFVQSKKDDFWSEVASLMFEQVFSNTFALGVGWVIHSFLL